MSKNWEQYENPDSEPDSSVGTTDFEFGKNSNNPGTITECSGTVECTACGKHHGWCDDLTRILKGEQMLPQVPQGTQPSRSGTPAGKNTNRFRPEDLSGEPRQVKIVDVRVEEKPKNFGGGAQVVAKVAVNGGTKFWYLDIAKNPNYEVLVAKFGHDENDWVQKTILCHAEEDGFYGNLVIKTTFPETATPRKK